MIDFKRVALAALLGGVALGSVPAVAEDRWNAPGLLHYVDEDDDDDRERDYRRVQGFDRGVWYEFDGRNDDDDDDRRRYGYRDHDDDDDDDDRRRYGSRDRDDDDDD